jgi:ADP-heptose:LPS heptosyltransferase
VHTDCRHYRVSEPCAPHKQTRVTCAECRRHDPIAERVLIVKLGALGDVLRTTSCLPPLKSLYPRSHVTWVTRANAAPLLFRNPAVDRVLSVDSNYLEYLLVEDFDLVIAPDADPLSASIAGIAHAPTKKGFVTDGRGGVKPLSDAATHWWQMGLNDDLKQRNRRTYGEWLYAICDLPLPIARPYLFVAPEALTRASQQLQAQAPRSAIRICFNTGASGRWREKRWKACHYQSLAQRITAAVPAAAIVLVGGPEEHAFNRELLLSGTPFIDGGTDNSLEEFAAILAACAWTVTPDSLGYHVACAVGTRAVCLVGPTSPWEIDLFAANRVIYSPFDCIGCYLATCPMPRTCMDALMPETVWASVSDWMPDVDRSALAVRAAKC